MGNPSSALTSGAPPLDFLHKPRYLSGDGLVPFLDLEGGGVSVEAVSWVLDHAATKTVADRMVLVVLAEHADELGANAWPSVATIARRAALSERQTFYSLRALREQGLAVANGRSPKGTTNYSLPLHTLHPAHTAPAEAAPPPLQRLQVTPAETAPEPPRTILKPPKDSPDVRVVYDHWRSALGKTDSRYNRMSEARRRKITARLKDGFTAQQLCEVFDIAARDPWEERRKHSDIEVLLRNRGKVDWWLDQGIANGNGHTKTGAERLREAMAARGVA